MPDWISVETVISVVIGGIISAVISYGFAWKSRKELRAEFDALFRFLQTAEDADARIERDEKGRPRTLRILYGAATLTSRTSASAEASVVRAENEDEGEEG